MFQFNIYGLVGLTAVAACWIFATVLYRVGSAGTTARMLAHLLVVEGITLGSAGYIVAFFTPEAMASSWFPAYFRAETVVHTLGDCTMLALYPPFLAAALHTKLTRPFGTKRARITLAAIAIMLFFAILFSSDLVSPAILFVMLSTLFGFALIASIHAWTVAQPGIARSRARIFALAFGVRDMCWGIIYVYGISQIFAGTYFTEKGPEYFFLVYSLGTLFAVPLIAYGILRTQLFDIDLRVRWTIKQSTLAAVFVASVYLISEGADRFLSSELGNIAGLLASALVVFFLAPLQRFAERVASVAMPNTENTPEYAAYRKLQVYEAAVAEAQQEGGISDKERSLLNRLRDSLEISPTDAETLERDLASGAIAH
jgi:hypothetical protein